MDTAKINTLKQVNNAIQQIDIVMNDPATNVAQLLILEKTSSVLENIKNNIIEQSEETLIDALTKNTADLSKLADQINRDNATLNQVAGTINKVASILGILTNITTAAVSAGLL